MKAGFKMSFTVETNVPSVPVMFTTDLILLKNRKLLFWKPIRDSLGNASLPGFMTTSWKVLEQLIRTMSMMEKEPVLPIYIKHSNFLFFWKEGSISYIQQGYIKLIKSGRKYINNLSSDFYFKQMLFFWTFMFTKCNTVSTNIWSSTIVLITNKKK